MTLTTRIKIAILALVSAALVTVGPAWIGYQIARGDTPVLIAQADTDAPDDAVLIAQADTLDAGVPAADTAQPAAPATTSSPATAPAPLQASDVGVMTKLYKGGAFFALGIMVLFVGLSIWSKLDKKHAFYIATGLGGVALLVESIRKGDTPNALSVMTMLMTTGGIMIAGPGHVKAS